MMFCNGGNSRQNCLGCQRKWGTFLAQAGFGWATAATSAAVQSVPKGPADTVLNNLESFIMELVFILEQYVTDFLIKEVILSKVALIGLPLQPSV